MARDNTDLADQFKAIPTLMGVPAIEHPWFQGLISGELSEEQILLGEIQHTRRGWVLEEVVKDILDKAISEGDEDTIAVARADYEEEAGGPKGHGDLMFQFHEAQMTREEVLAVDLMPGTIACIAMLREGAKEFSALGSLAMMTLPEWQNATVSAAVYPALRTNTSLSDYAIDTYRVHAEADIDHGDRQLELLARKVQADPSQQRMVETCLAYGVETFNHNWDGQYQAAIGNPYFRWAGTEF